jgi:signal transduction histidine kinase
MASIGQLTAGIAHEINNPINYVTSNISSLERDLNEINSVIEAYSTINNENFAEKLIEIDQLKAELDYDYLQEEIPTLLEGIKEGADRTANIVASLRVFSNEDKQTKTAANISLGINSSITLLSSKLENIEVKTDYKIEKRVYCFPGKLNQIVMNILSNAIDAINEKKKTHDFDGLIEVLLAEKKNEIIQIEIKDNGIGMDEETKKKVFDPFFTSKEVGSGTGLGMALTYQFIKLHNGDITIDSEPNKGTTITVSFKNEKGDE